MTVEERIEDYKNWTEKVKGNRKGTGSHYVLSLNFENENNYYDIFKTHCQNIFGIKNSLFEIDNPEEFKKIKKSIESLEVYKLYIKKGNEKRKDGGFLQSGMNSYLKYLMYKDTTKPVSTVLKELSQETQQTNRRVNKSSKEEIWDSIYQQEVYEVDDNVDDSLEDDSPEQYVGENNHSNTNSRPDTNPKRGKRVIKQYGYKCFFGRGENPHLSFVSKDGFPYIEVHHLIPMGKQYLFKNMLDKSSNIIPLCPNCHKKIHYGNKKEVDLMLIELYEDRKERLEKSGIPISLKDLKKMY